MVHQTDTERAFAPIRHEHAALRPHIDDLRGAADAVGLPSARDAFELVDAGWRFLTEHLLPHAKAEEEVLYPAFTAVLDTPEATRLLSLDHEVITGLIHELGDLRRKLADHDHIGGELAADLRRVLYGLHALITAHFAKEEAVVLPVLEGRLEVAEARALMARLHHPA